MMKHIAYSFVEWMVSAMKVSVAAYQVLNAIPVLLESLLLTGLHKGNHFILHNIMYICLRQIFFCLTKSKKRLLRQCYFLSCRPCNSLWFSFIKVMEVIYPWLGWIWGGVGLVSGKEDVRAYSSAVKWCNKKQITLHCFSVIFNELLCY